MFSKSAIGNILHNHNPLVLALQIPEKSDEINMLHPCQRLDLALELLPQMVVVDALLGAFDRHDGAVAEGPSVDGAKAALSDLEGRGEVLGGFVDIPHTEDVSNLSRPIDVITSNIVPAAAFAIVIAIAGGIHHHPFARSLG